MSCKKIITQFIRLFAQSSCGLQTRKDTSLRLEKETHFMLGKQNDDFQYFLLFFPPSSDNPSIRVQAVIVRIRCKYEGGVEGVKFMIYVVLNQATLCPDNPVLCPVSCILGRSQPQK